MKKMTYNDAKAELSARRGNTKYFNRSFWRTYIKTKSLLSILSEKGNLDDDTVKNAWRDVYSTDFYNKNSCAYCEFLCIAYDKELVA